MDPEEKKVFRPSSIERYVNCNLWRWLPQEEKSEEQIAYLKERTKDHERLEQEQFTDKENSCKAYFDRVKSSCVYFFKEQTTEIPFEEEFLEGTPDVYGYDEETKTLHIIDYKTGRSYVVAEDNIQLLAYAMLAMERHYDWNIEKIELAILNTQHDGVSTYVYTGKLQIDRLKKEIIEAREKNSHDLSFGKPGKWCYFCPAKRYCIRQKKHQFKDYTDLDTDTLIYTTKLRGQEMIAREKEVKEGAYSELLSPLVVERTKRSWKDHIPEKFYLKKAMTLAEAKKAFPEEGLEEYTEEKTYKILKPVS